MGWSWACGDLRLYKENAVGVFTNIIYALAEN